jgi:hypothetical protein
MEYSKRPARTKSVVFNIIFNYNEPNLTMTPTQTHGRSRMGNSLTELMIGFCRKAVDGSWRTRWYKATRKNNKLAMQVAPQAQFNLR